jgi:hypothetical protein
MHFFNTAGPVREGEHYLIPPLERFDLEKVLFLIQQKKYFVLHAPRQTGKTSCMLALMEYLNKTGKFKALYCNVEAAQGVREDIKRGNMIILDEIAGRAEYHLKTSLLTEIKNKILDRGIKDNALNRMLSEWCQNSELPVVLFIDEIDSLIGDTLISILRQIRSGYDKRPESFPQSIVLFGVRDVRDYRIHSDKNKEIITGGSAFNIRAKSLRLGNFSKQETSELLSQHEKNTGQLFEADAKSLIWDYTQGQPWLVNALAYEVCFEMEHGRNRSVSITKEMIEQAKDNMILRRETHLDQLADKLKEDRVRRVIGPVLEGTSIDNIAYDDIQYVMDLGLLVSSESGLCISNSIYKEIIPRELAVITQYNLEPLFRPSWYILPDGRLDDKALITAFQEFFRENSEIWLERFDYKEAAPQLIMQAFLQRIVNSGGRIDREYGLGRRRTDLLISKKYGKNVQKIVIELKILYKNLDETIKEGLKQTAEYMDKCGAKNGNLIIFDRRKNQKWSDKIFCRKEKFEEKNITVWGM